MRCQVNGGMLATVDASLRRFLGRSAVDVAPQLLGWTFGTRIDGVFTAVRLTEVEAYICLDRLGSGFSVVSLRLTDLAAEYPMLCASQAITYLLPGGLPL